MWVNVAARPIYTHPLSGSMAIFDTPPLAFPLMLPKCLRMDNVTVMHFRNGCVVYTHLSCFECKPDILKATVNNACTVNRQRLSY